MVDTEKPFSLTSFDLPAEGTEKHLQSRPHPQYARRNKQRHVVLHWCRRPLPLVATPVPLEESR